MSEQIKRIFDFHYKQLSTPLEKALSSKAGGKWKAYSTQEMIEIASKTSKGLLNLGISPGDKVAVISENRPEWHLCDLAMIQLGIITVPIYPTITEVEYDYILRDAQVKLILVSNEEILNKVKGLVSSNDDILDVYTFDQISGHKHWSEITKTGEGFDQKEIQSYSDTVKEDDLATLIYTSGTTGKPKGVMISHKNLVSNVVASTERLPVKECYRALSFLPLCHVYERMLCYMYIYNNIGIYYAESLEQIGENLKEVKPNVFGTVPRLLEKVYDKIIAKGTELTGLKKKLFFWAVETGLKFDPRQSGGLMYSLQLKIVNKLIFSKWREALGGEVKAVASGASALQPRLARVFQSAGIPVMEGYGLTETSPVLAVNCQENNGVMIGTVGRPLSNVEIKIAEDGEILAKGPNLMQGYYNKPELTAEVIDKDGWFHTGDIGIMVEGEFLKITDRKKEIFKTSGGKYIAPQVMENKFKESRFIEQIMVIGENEKHPSAFIQPDFVFLREWAKRNAIHCDEGNNCLIENDAVYKRIMQEVNSLNENFARYEQLKKIALVSSVWSPDSGELTPTMKLKRAVIMKKYIKLYEDIYNA